MAEFITIAPQWTENDRCVIMEAHGNGIIEVEITKSLNPQLGYIWDLYVLPEARLKGLGRELLHEAEKFIKSRGVTKAVLRWDQRDSPIEVYRWYEREGYKETSFGRYVSQLEKMLAV